MIFSCLIQHSKVLGMFLPDVLVYHQYSTKQLNNKKIKLINISLFSIAELQKENVGL